MTYNKKRLFSQIKTNLVCLFVKLQLTRNNFQIYPPKFAFKKFFCIVKTLHASLVL